MPNAGHLLGGWMDPQYPHVFAFTTSQSFCPASHICVLFDSFCIAHIRTWLLVILCALLLALTSLIILLCRCSSLRPHMNYSLIHLSYSWYSHSFSANFTLLIHSSIFSSLCLFNSQNQRDLIVWILSLFSFCKFCLSLQSCLLFLPCISLDYIHYYLPDLHRCTLVNVHYAYVSCLLCHLCT